MNDEQLFLANAYVDGELTADERRTADADPQVMAEVERLSALRRELRDVPEPSPEAREAAITAAMAEFGSGAGPGAATTGDVSAEPAVIPFRPRPAYAKYLAVAAALVAVAGLGIVLTQTTGSDDSTDLQLSGAVAETVARQEVVASDDAATEAGDESTESREAVEHAEAPAEDVAAAPAPEPDDGDTFEMIEEEAAEEAASAEPGFGADAEGATRISVPDDFDPDTPIADEIELAVYGAYLLDLRDRRLLGATPETRCFGEYEILGTAVAVIDGDERDVYVGVNELDGFVVAIDTDRCDELAIGWLF